MREVRTAALDLDGDKLDFYDELTRFVEDQSMGGTRVFRRRGLVPPQKWMNFYTKVLSRFASSPDLKLEVSIEIKIDYNQAQSKADETRSGLKDLGLDDTATLS